MKLDNKRVLIEEGMSSEPLKVKLVLILFLFYRQHFLTGNEYPDLKFWFQGFWLEFQSKTFYLEETKTMIFKKITQRKVFHFTDQLLVYSIMTFQAKFSSKEKLIPMFEVTYTCDQYCSRRNFYYFLSFNYSQMISHFEMYW
jgi:hypothetical protein